MKREGRQHGMVRSYQILPSPWTPRPLTRFVNRFDSPPQAGLFTKVSPKPTNHSKFTGKCGRPRCSGCRMHPVCKAKDKTKGTHKLKSCDVVANYRLVSWRVVDGQAGLNCFGLSATGILDHISDAYGHDHDNDYEVDDLVNGGFNNGDHYRLRDEINDQHYDYYDNDDGYEDDDMSFCDVGFILDQEGEGDDDDWCIVEEM